jgi:hypothetical protein
MKRCVVLFYRSMSIDMTIRCHSTPSDRMYTSDSNTGILLFFPPFLMFSPSLSSLLTPMSTCNNLSHFHALESGQNRSTVIQSKFYAPSVFASIRARHGVSDTIFVVILSVSPFQRLSVSVAQFVFTGVFDCSCRVEFIEGSPWCQHID